MLCAIGMVRDENENGWNEQIDIGSETTKITCDTSFMHNEVPVRVHK